MDSVRVIGPEAATKCPQETDGNCMVATGILGHPCAINSDNCRACGAKATPEAPTAPAVGLAIGQAVKDGDEATAGRIQKDYWSILVPPVPDARTAVQPTAPESVACVYRQATSETHACATCWAGKGRVVPIFHCAVYDRKCTIDSDFREGNRDPLHCRGCDKRKSPMTNPAEWRKARCTYLQNPTAWAGRYQGGTLFLVCGGPSLEGMDLNLIPSRGPTIMAVNNAAAFIPRADLWVSMDEAGRYSPTIWRDSRLVKFAELARTREPIRDVADDGSLRMSVKAETLANVNTIVRHGDAFDVSTFFTSGTLQSGQYAERDEKGAQIVIRKSTMTWALRLAVDLGFSTINIVGADFHMEAGKPYAWNEVKARPGDVRGCNSTMAHVNQCFAELVPHLKAIGVNVYNCTPGGNLTAFPRRDFAEACAAATLKAPASLHRLYHWWSVRLGVITCTADRPRCFSLLRYDMERQTRRPHLWVIADTGRTRVKPPDGSWVRHLELNPQPTPWDSFMEAMAAGVEAAAAAGMSHVAFCEDDDRYLQGWLDEVVNVLGTGVRIFGDQAVRQYNLPERRWRLFNNREHASMAQTAMAIDTARKLIQTMRMKGPRMADMRVWLETKEAKRLESIGTMHVAMKGLAGPIALAGGHDPARIQGWNHDPDGAKLAEWIGAERAAQYRDWNSARN